MNGEITETNGSASYGTGDEHIDVVSPGRQALTRFLKNKIAVFGAILLAALGLFVVLGPIFWKLDPNKPSMTDIYRPPFSNYGPLGTDDIGRDVFARLMAGGRVSLSIGLACAIVSISIGSLVGALAGYFGKAADNALMRFTDIFLTIPTLPLLIVLGGMFSPSPPVFVFLVSVLNWMTTARLVRSRFLTLRSLDYVTAARSVGCKNSRIIFSYLLPNTVGPIVVTATLTVGRAIIMESTLSFLGVGITPPTATWGNMLHSARFTMIRSPWLTIIPGMMILLTVLAINFIGDGLNDALDPKQSR